MPKYHRRAGDRPRGFQYLRFRQWARRVRPRRNSAEPGRVSPRTRVRAISVDRQQRALEVVGSSEGVTGPNCKVAEAEVELYIAV